MSLHDGLTPEREVELAIKYGLAEVPKSRYEDMPEVPLDAEGMREFVTFKKALACVDPISTAAFHRYIPAQIVVDRAIDPRSFRRGWSSSVLIHTDRKIPVNPKITHATGITSKPCETNWYIWLADTWLWQYRESGARASSPPLLFRSRGKRKKEGGYAIHPFIGIVFKLDRTPKDALTMDDMQASVGVLYPKLSMHSSNQVLPVAQPVETEPEPLIKLPT